MRSTSNWLVIFLSAALLGVLVGYLITVTMKPQLLPAALRFGGLTQPMTVLVLGTDVVYSGGRRGLKADLSAFSGRSDTIMVARFDPYRNSYSVLSIPRDTMVEIPGQGTQKINGANALGGPKLAEQTVTNLLGVPIDHYVVINVHGLVELVDELGGLEVDIPKRMKYRDRSAKLNIDLQPGVHKLTGTEAMGFVRFRHDELGDIGRVQRQEIFIHALTKKALEPESWAKLPQLLVLADKHIQTDMSPTLMASTLAFARSVPKTNQQMIMLPGRFSGSGNWDVDEEETQQIVRRFTGADTGCGERCDVKMVVENGSSSPDAARKLYRMMSDLGYNVVTYKSKVEVQGAPLSETRIIAQRGNTEEAVMVKKDLHDCGSIVNASVGDIQSAITVIAGDDLLPYLSDKQKAVQRKATR